MGIDLGSLQQNRMAVEHFYSPASMNKSQLAAYASQHSSIDLDHLPNPLAQSSAFQVFTLTHKADFAFNGIMYSSVIDAFSAQQILDATNWEERREGIMADIFRAKFGSGDNQDYLLATLDTELLLLMPAEYAPLWRDDPVNRLGRLLMEVRDEFKTETF